MSPNDITGIHHVGLVVADMDRALSVFRRLGFGVGAPKYPALPIEPGGPPRPIGAGNTHADFPRDFVELVALAPHDREHLPAGAGLVPLSVPADRLAATRRAMLATVANLQSRLALGEGAHILVFASRDAEVTARRLDEAGIGHGGARPAQRPIATADGVRLADIRFLEIDGDDPAAGTGLVDEGRVGIAEDAPAELLDAQLGLEHPNGATGLVDSVVAVGEDGFASTVERYERYLGFGAVGRDPAVFELGSSRLLVATGSRSRELFPGAEPVADGGDGRAAARLAAYTIEVADLGRTRRLLSANGFRLGHRPDGGLFVQAADALGTVIAFRERAAV